jgi:hypothetical protein
VFCGPGKCLSCRLNGKYMVERERFVYVQLVKLLDNPMT